MSLRDRMAQQAQQEFKLEFISEVSPQKALIGYRNSAPFRAYAILTNSYTQEQTRHDIFQCTTKSYYRDGDYGLYEYSISDNDDKKLREQLIEFIFTLDEQGWDVEKVAQYMVNYRSTLNVTIYGHDQQLRQSTWKNTHLTFTINRRH